MSTRYNTGNPIESTDVRDMSDNAKNFDEFSNSTSDSFTDRFGHDRQTVEGAIRRVGFQPAQFDFVTGGTLFNGDRNKAVFNPLSSGDGNWYAWQGTLPKVINAGSTPETSGGLGDYAWKPVTNNIKYAFESVHEMASSNPVEGCRYITLGYNYAGDGGQGTYIISSTAASDNWVDIQCLNGLVAVLQHNGTVLTKQCGAVDTENSLNHQKLRTLCTKYGVSKVQFNGMHPVDKCVFVGSDKFLWSPLRRCKTGYGLRASSAFIEDGSTATIDNACLLCTENYSQLGNASYLSDKNITISCLSLIYTEDYNYSLDTRASFFNHIVANNVTKMYVGGCYATGGKNHFIDGVTLNDFHFFDNEVESMGFSPIQINSGSGGLSGQGVASYTAPCKDGKIFDNHIRDVQSSDIRPAIHLHVQACQDIEIFRNHVREVKYGIGSDFVFNVRNAYTNEIIIPSDTFAMAEDTNVRIYDNDVVADVVGIALCRGGGSNAIYNNTVRARVGIATSSNLASGLSTDVHGNRLNLCEVPIDACCVSGSAADISNNEVASDITVNNGRIQVRGGSANVFNNTLRGGGGIIFRDFVETAAFNGITKTSLLAEIQHGGNNMVLAAGGRMVDYETSATNYTAMCHDYGNASNRRIDDKELYRVVTPRGIEYLRGGQRQMTAWMNATNTNITDYTGGKATNASVYWSATNLGSADDIGVPLYNDPSSGAGVFVSYNSSTGKWVAVKGSAGFGYTNDSAGGQPVLRTTGFFKIVFSN
ncbi:MAG: hypothetical protein ACRCVV_21250 [Shewanella sp.]